MSTSEDKNWHQEYEKPGTQSPVEKLRKVLAHTTLTVKYESKDLGTVQVTNIDIPLSRMIWLLFKFTIATAVIWIPIYLAALFILSL